MPQQVATSLYGMGIGSSSTNPFITIFQTRDPLSTDVNYPIQQRWFNTSDKNEWILVSFTTSAETTTANWDLITTGTQNTETLTGNTGGAVSVDTNNNINVVGDGNTITIAGNSGTHTLTASTIGPYTPTTFTAHGVLVGEGSSSIAALTVGTTGQLLGGNTGADPAFTSSSNGDFTFTSSSGGSTRTLTVTNTSNTASSQARELIQVAGTSAGDCWTEYSINGTRNWCIGIKNSPEQRLYINNNNGSVSPSSGTNFMFFDPTAVPFTQPAIGLPVQYVSQSFSGAGSEVVFQVVHGDPSNLSSNARVEIDTQPTGGDPYIDFTIDTVNSWCLGIDNSDSDIIKINYAAPGGPVTPSTGTNTWKMTTTGIRTIPLQPCFSSTIATTVMNVTGDGTNYTVIFNTVAFDQNSNYSNSTGIFTAPATGRYLFNAHVMLGNLGALFTSGSMYLVTTSKTYNIDTINVGAVRDVNSNYTFTSSLIVPMSATDTAFIRINVSGSTKTIFVIGDADVSGASSFSGSLLC